MANKKLFKTGIVGICVSAVCCFTPALVLLLGVLGFSAWLTWLDYVLIPSLVMFIALTLYAWFRKSNVESEG